MSEYLVENGLALNVSGRFVEGMYSIYQAAIQGNKRGFQVLSSLTNSEQNITIINPLNVQAEPSINQFHQIPNLTNSFRNDLIGLFNNLDPSQNRVSENDILLLVAFYTIDLLIEYSEKAEVLPIPLIHEIKNQVIQAAKSIFDLFQKSEVVSDYNTTVEMKIWNSNIKEITFEYLSQYR